MFVTFAGWICLKHPPRDDAAVALFWGLAIPAAFLLFWPIANGGS
jgi:hypothetical protein